MARAKKRNDGRYVSSFRVDGKKYYVYGRSAAEIGEKKLQKIKDIAAGIQKRRNPTLKEYYESFKEIHRQKVKPATIRTQEKHFKACAAVDIDGQKFGELKIRDIKPADCQKVQAALLEKSSTRTVNDRMAHLKHVFSAAVKDETIKRNPCDCLDRIRRTEPPARETVHRALTLEETNRFFIAAEQSHYKNAFRLMLQTGIRIGEIGALRTSDIDSINNCIHISRTVTRDELNGYTVGDSAKTATSARDIPMNETVKQIFRDQREYNRDIFGNVLQMDGLLFRTVQGCIIRECTVNSEIKRICKKAGIDYFTSHAFRATFATRFIEQRPEDYKVLSEILGHADIKITLNLYTHVMKESKQKAMENIEIAM